MNGPFPFVHSSRPHRQIILKREIENEAKKGYYSKTAII